ncbi:YrhK family protein [Qingshengfaniella alkalisoli]|uniref:YrhK domain-containing protein n=1 Tax=Qingshengfaniella alkalisoli TaxID=2599296 RepID=A0A5B8I5I4_9RHOB|nr:YrhK family protein [Qingshengfaniella alkalisoli]QDY68609.1 hypothetical protein FPZ52_02560 [Qingshengfaniella alkalisoli]
MARLFERDHRDSSEKSRRLYAAYEILYTGVDFGAALTFIIGSFMFLSEEWQTVGTYFFIVGSFLFAAKPTIRLVREIRLARMGDVEDLAERLGK